MRPYSVIIRRLAVSQEDSRVYYGVPRTIRRRAQEEKALEQHRVAPLLSLQGARIWDGIFSAMGTASRIYLASRIQN